MSPPAILHRLSVLHLLIASILVVSLVAMVSKPIKHALMLNPYRVGRGELHRLLTAGWVHADLAHLIVNMFVLYVFANRAIATFGQFLFVGVYASAVVVAFIPTTVRYLKRPHYNSLGASGAVAAVMFSAIMVDPSLKLRLLLLPIPVPGVVFGLLYLAYSVWHSHGADDNINHDAHFSGAIYGALVTYAWAPAQVERTLRVWTSMVGL